jgi:hypothetical protein
MHDDEPRLALMYRQDGSRFDTMWIPTMVTRLDALDRPPKGVLHYDWPARSLSFRYAMLTLGRVSFYLEDGPAKPWYREVRVSPELVSDGGALETVAVGAAMHDEAEPGTIHLWTMRVLPAHEGDDMIRLWLCGSAVPKVRVVNERQG